MGTTENIGSAKDNGESKAGYQGSTPTKNRRDEKRDNRGGDSITRPAQTVGSLSGLIDIIQTLRSENGRPWDKQQTPETIWKCLAEEMYELLAAIKDDDHNEICEELGDVLFQIVFIAEIYREEKIFDIDKSIALIAEKMIRRHPHIYGDAAVSDEAELWANWERIKREEKEKKQNIKNSQESSNSTQSYSNDEKKQSVSILDSVPVGMPALMRSYKIAERAVRAGFDWKDIDEVISKAFEEWEEFKAALASGNKDEIAMEFGDVLFTLNNVARLAGIHPELALNASTAKFEKRFRYMEGMLYKSGLSLKDIPRQELESLWDKAKQDCI